MGILINSDAKNKALKSYTILNGNEIYRTIYELKEVMVSENDTENTIRKVDTSSEIKNYKKSVVEKSKVIPKDKINPIR